MKSYFFNLVLEEYQNERPAKVEWIADNEQQALEQVQKHYPSFIITPTK